MEWYVIRNKHNRWVKVIPADEMNIMDPDIKIVCGCDSRQFADRQARIFSEETGTPIIKEMEGMKMETLLYQEEWTYEWKKSKAKIMECEAVQSFKDLWSPEFYSSGELIYVIDEKQLYRASHKRHLRYLGVETEKASAATPA